MDRRAIAAGCVLLIGLGVVAAHARDSQQPIQVSGNVTAVVSVSATSLDFGRASFVGDTRASAQISLYTDAARTVRIRIDGGRNGSRADRSGTRYLTHRLRIGTLAYWLYQDREEKVLWGDDGASNVGSSLGVSTSQRAPTRLTVYGKIAQQSLSQTAGTYDDVVTVSVAW